tara:strand:- start:3613 stop:4191 length:579 start_codon:yes stop_codon:yes gene_type:complete
MKNFCLAFCIALFVYLDPAFSSEAGMPQLNPEFWVAQIFWLTIIFSGLYLIIWKIFLPKITYSIENRKSRIVNDIQEAQKLKESAEIKLNEYKKIIENSKKEAKKIMEDSRKQLDKDIDSKKQKIDDEIAKELLAAEKEIKDLKSSSIVNISKIAVEISSEITKQIINSEVNKSNVSIIVNDITKKMIGKNT